MKRPVRAAEDERSRQRGETSHCMHDDRAGEIGEAHRRECPAAPFPHPADGIDEARNDDRVDQVAHKLHTPSNGSRHNRRGGGEGDLKQEVSRVAPAQARRCLGPGAVIVLLSIACHHGRPTIAEPLPLVVISGIHEGIADKQVQQHAKCEVHHVLEQNVDSVLLRVETDFNECETGLHEQHEDGTQEHDQGVDRVTQIGRRIEFDRLLGYFNGSCRRLRHRFRGGVIEAIDRPSRLQQRA
ncbi:MAG: hypothetical protein R3B90_08640 [Planctomycetaceae bacterium]